MEFESNKIWSLVPKLCRQKKCPYRAFVFEYTPHEYGATRVTGLCLLHAKYAARRHDLNKIVFRSRKELEDLLLTTSIIEG